MLHKYYFKIKKNDTELEFATDDLEDFDTKVSEWVNVICNPRQSVENPSETKRMDFIEIKELVNIKKITAPQEPSEEIPFEEILEESISNPKIDLDNRDVEENELALLLEEKKPKDAIDALIIASFYLLHLENIDRQSLKQLNSRLVPIGNDPITHFVMQNAIDKGFMEVIPDLTGFGDVTEYALTQKGEEYYYNGF